MEGLVAGLSNKLIAREYDISPRTIEVYRANVMTKMQAGSLSELVRLAMRAGIDQGLSQVNSADRQMRYFVEDDRRPNQHHRTMTETPASAQKPMIYVVDDDSDVLGSLRFLLETGGFRRPDVPQRAALLGSSTRQRRGLPRRRLQDGGTSTGSNWPTGCGGSTSLRRSF